MTQTFVNDLSYINFINYKSIYKKNNMNFYIKI